MDLLVYRSSTDKPSIWRDTRYTGPGSVCEDTSSQVLPSFSRWYRRAERDCQTTQSMDMPMPFVSIDYTYTVLCSILASLRRP